MLANCSLASKRVLVCDDEALIILHLEKTFRRAGMEIVGRASTGLAAVEIALVERPEVVVLDLHLPVLDGLEAARRIRAIYPACIVVVTAEDAPEYRERAFEAGVAAYLVKPISGDAIAIAVGAAIERTVAATAGLAVTAPSMASGLSLGFEGSKPPAQTAH